MAQALANRLWEAEQLAQLVDLQPPATTPVTGKLAYRAQSAGRALRTSAGSQLVGYKVGVTSAAGQKALGTDEPVHGYLLDRGMADDGALLGSPPLRAPRIEVEIAFVLGSPVLAGDTGEAEILAATDHCRLALEIVDSRWSQRAPLGLLIADNVSAARVVLGPRVALDTIDWDSLAATLTVGDRVTRGSSAKLGHPAAFVAWLARSLRGKGERLEAGQTIMSGTLIPPVPASPGDHASAEFAGLGRVTASFT
jgi:2-keto-4-pentenoate hydratase